MGYFSRTPARIESARRPPRLARLAGPAHPGCRVGRKDAVFDGAGNLAFRLYEPTYADRKYEHAAEGQLG